MWPNHLGHMAPAILMLALWEADKEEKKAKMTPEELKEYEEAERRAKEYRARQRAQEEARCKAEYDDAAAPFREQRRLKNLAKFEAEQRKKAKP